MLDAEKFDFSKESKIMDKLLEECMKKRKELDKEQIRKPISIEEISGISDKKSKIEANKLKETSIKIGKNK